ncbi:MAG: TauD/TfdA family dioxygenase [Burkholderiaceae bacterium]
MNNLNDPFVSQREPVMPGQPVIDPAGWTSSQMQASGQWLYQLSDQEVDEIVAAVRRIETDRVDALGLSAEDFELPNFAPVLRTLRAQLAYGHGLVMLRGLPVDELGKRGTALAFWAVSQHLGDGVWSQNKLGHVLGHVTDLGQSKSNPSQRGPYSKELIPFHVDCADLVGLLCVETAVAGGESSIASSVTVHNRLLRERPDLLNVLYQPYYRDRRDEIPPGMKPWYRIAVFHQYQGYFSSTIEPTYMKSADRFDDVPEMTTLQREALSVVQEIAAQECLDMGFQRGDMQFLNNHVIMHSRRGYQDSDDVEHKRHLLRIWLKLLDARPLPDAFYERHGVRSEIDRPGGIVGSDTALSAPLTRT